MNGDDCVESGESQQELREKLREARSKIRELENELTETNEGMIALTLELENAKERYQTIFEESNDAILLIDPEQDSIHEANPQACELLGYSRDSLVSLSASEIFMEKGEGFESFPEAVVQGWGAGFSCLRKDGRRLDVELSAAMITLEGRSLLLASLRDVTERKRREQRLQVLNRIFRHNLRNEGNIIQGHADILQEELSDSDLEPNAATIQETINHMLGLSTKVRRVQDVLDRKRIHPHELDDLLETQREICALRYPAATLTIDLPTEDVVVGQRLGVALREAVENACEHNDPDTSVRISAETEGNDERLLLEIEDDGSGIPDHERETMETGGETALTHGSGIGLWVIQWVVSSLGGELRIEEGDPHGTVLSIDLPLEEPRGDSGPVTRATEVNR